LLITKKKQKTRPTVLVSLTNDHGVILKALATIQIQGSVNLTQTLQTAQLCLRHRKNKSQRARICLFIGSPIKSSIKDIKQIAKTLRRDGIALDIFSFGEIEENEPILSELFKAVNVKDNSKYVTVAPETYVLADAAMNAIYVSGMGGGDAPQNGGGEVSASAFDEYGGVDPNLDPELAMAIRMSREEYNLNLRQNPEQDAPVNNNNSENNESIVNNDNNISVDDDELQKAILLSQLGNQSDDKMEESPNNNNNDNNNNNNNNNVTTENNDNNNDQMEISPEDDEEYRLAMELSLKTASSSDAPEEEKKEDIVSEAISDPNFLGSLMDSFPGLDPNDPLIKDALDQLNNKKKE